MRENFRSFNRQVKKAGDAAGVWAVSGAWFSRPCQGSGLEGVREPRLRRLRRGLKAVAVTGPGMAGRQPAPRDSQPQPRRRRGLGRQPARPTHSAAMASRACAWSGVIPVSTSRRTNSSAASSARSSRRRRPCRSQVAPTVPEEQARQERVLTEACDV